jgi:hypothetical protein
MIDNCIYVAHYPPDTNSVAVTTAIRCFFPHEFAHAKDASLRRCYELTGEALTGQWPNRWQFQAVSLVNTESEEDVPGID